MPATTHVPLGATTTNRKWYVDASTSGTAAGPFVPVMGITNITFNQDNATLQDDSDFDSGGFGSDNKTSTKWMAQFNCIRKGLPSDFTAYDPGQEYLRLTAIGKVGPAATTFVRIYEMEPGGPRTEAYLGQAVVSWQDQGGGQDANSSVQVTLSGRGLLSQIAHPDTGAAIPTIAGVSPNTGLATAGGDLLIITGNRFTGTTGVTVGGTAATHVTVISDGKIACNAPAKAAGTYPVIVTNAAGASTVNPNVTYV